MYIISVNWSKVKCRAVTGVKSRCTVRVTYSLWSEVKWSEVKWSEVKWSEVKWSEVKWSGVRWSEVKILLKMVCYTCGLTTLEIRYCSFSPLCCFYYMRFVLICTVVVLYCFVMDVCVCVSVCFCVFVCGFCNVCVCDGFVMCIYLYTVSDWGFSYLDWGFSVTFPQL
jgi:hypothetical protein